MVDYASTDRFQTLTRFEETSTAQMECTKKKKKKNILISSIYCRCNPTTIHNKNASSVDDKQLGGIVLYCIVLYCIVLLYIILTLAFLFAMLNVLDRILSFNSLFASCSLCTSPSQTIPLSFTCRHELMKYRLLMLHLPASPEYSLLVNR